MKEAKFYTCETMIQTVPLEDFRRDLVDVPRFMGYCLDCSNAGRYWSCPPYDFDPQEIWARYGGLLLLVRKVTFRKDRLFPGERRAFERTELPKIKADMNRELLEMEAKIPGSLALFPGRCEWCPSCARGEGKPCRFPERMRYSVESLGGDCGGALERYFGEPLQWAQGNKLPERLLFLGGLLMPKDETE